MTARDLNDHTPENRPLRAAGYEHHAAEEEARAVIGDLALDAIDERKDNFGLHLLASHPVVVPGERSRRAA